MYEINKRFEFSASHRLHGLPASHQCARMHGHNYIVEVTIRADQLNHVGFIVDYGELAFVKALIDNYLDHRHLNDIFASGKELDFNPTAENMAKWFHDHLIPTLRQKIETEFQLVIGISETPKTWAYYTDSVLV